MPSNKLSIHTQAVNLARRYSVQNENDLLQESYCDEPGKKIWDLHNCQEYSNHLVHPNALPAECKKFQDVVTSLKRRDSDTTHPTQYLS